MSLSKRKIIVTGGPTREWIDPVRYLSNASSGKMGIAIAEAAAKRSEDTVFIHGPVDEYLFVGKKFRTVYTESTEDMLNAVIKELTPDCILIMAAAPADYRPENKYAEKIKKEDGSDELVLRLVKNPDILKAVSKKKISEDKFSGIFIAGFAAETNNTEENALKKFKSKNLDMICLNDVTQKDAGFGSDNNRIIIFTRGRETDSVIKSELPLISKSLAAEKILDCIELELVK